MQNLAPASPMTPGTTLAATLNDMKTGETLEVDSFSSDLAESLRDRLVDFGFHPGEPVTCLMAPGLGAPKLFKVSNTVYSLEDQIASKVHTVCGAGSRSGVDAK